MAARGRKIQRTQFARGVKASTLEGWYSQNRIGCIDCGAPMPPTYWNREQAMGKLGTVGA